MKINNVLVLIADDVPDLQGETFNKAGVRLPPETVSVVQEYNADTILGSAQLYQEEESILADIELFTEGEYLIRKALAGGAPLWPAIWGRVQCRKGKLIDVCEITGVSLGSRNQDVRIPSLSDAFISYFAKYLADGIMELEMEKPAYIPHGIIAQIQSLER